MACNASKVPFLRVISKRGLATNVCPRPVGKAADVETTVLGNKVVVASAESTLPISRVSIVFRAGSRNETYDTLGAAHLLGISTGLSTQKSSGFAITRNIQQIGGSLTATADREVVAYTVETTSNHIDCGLNYLQNVIQPAFKPWELSDDVKRVTNIVNSIPPQVRAIELLHKAAFRTGLGNSVYIPKFKIGKLSSESLLHFVANNFTAGRCAVVGVGIDQNTLSGFAQSLELPGGESSAEKPKIYSGDARKDTAGNIAHVAIGGEGGAISNQKEALAFALLKSALASTVTKRGKTSGVLGKALESAVGSNTSVSFNVLNASYSDTGLFGIVISAGADHISKAVEAAASALKKASITEADVNRAKGLLKREVMETYSSDNALIKELGVQAVLTREVISADALSAAIDGVTLQDVQEAAKKLGSSKLSIGAVGNLANVPYVSDLA